MSVAAIQPFGLFALAGVALGVVTVVLLGRKRGIPGAQLGLIVPLATFAVAFGSHFFDVAWYQWDRASQDSMLWLRIYQGVSVFGGVAGAALVIWPLASNKPTPLGTWADIAALGMLVGLFVGRIGCALVHDHPGVPTDLPAGVDFPVDRLWFEGARELAGGEQFLRLHDVGLEELVLLLPLLIAAFAMRDRFTRPGMLAALISIGYAAIRFPLDLLRLAESEPTKLGLTGGQWGCLVLAVVAGLALRKR